MANNEFMQRRFLLNKAGLGSPRIVSEAQTNQNPPNQPKPPKTSPSQTQPKKPGCGACSRRKST
jgi:hypothetical protein